MIYTDEQLRSKITEMIRIFETEAVEFKEAKSSYSFNDIGKYFSALSNEANLRSLREAFLLDRVQKKAPITHENYANLRKRGLVEGRYPNIFVSFKVATAVGQKTEYIRNRGLDESVCKHLIKQALEIQPATMPELLEVLDRGALSAVLTPAQKNRKVSNLLQKMKADGSIVPEGPRNRTKWHLVKNDKT